MNRAASLRKVARLAQTIGDTLRIIEADAERDGARATSDAAQQCRRWAREIEQRVLLEAKHEERAAAAEVGA